VTAPLVGVVVPCFNQGVFAAECIASIEAQTYRNLRVMLLDDASTDGSGSLLDALASDRVEVVHLSENFGRALVRNEAVRRLGAAPAFFLIVDCDDRLSPDYLSQLMGALRSDPSAGLAYGTLHFFGDLRDSRTTWPDSAYVHEKRFLENVVPGPGVLFRAEALRSTAGWREAFAATGNEDVDLWLQVVEGGWRPAWVPSAVYHYRHHPGSFLSSSAGQATRVAGALTILAHHRRAIATTIGVDTYLEHHAMPWVLAEIRSGRLGAIGPLLRRAPASTLRLLARHYARRIRARGRREGGR
jgi:glycosyltransferase involved in cell wall biosynthesis